jgi:hypothetical protein
MSTITVIWLPLPAIADSMLNTRNILKCPLKEYRVHKITSKLELLYEHYYSNLASSSSNSSIHYEVMGND